LLILIDERGKKYLLNSDQDFHNDLGIIKKEALQECQPGDILETHMGKNIKVVKADVNDLIELMQRRCSILLPKDIGIVISNTGLGCGDRVVDAGTGAGAIALHFANVVGNNGKVYSYEIREDFAQIARSNIDQFQFDNVEIKNKDIKEGIDEEDVDLVFLDLPKPWEMLESVYYALKAGGWLAVGSPVPSVRIVRRALGLLFPLASRRQKPMF
jgi:tRNA (adenine57-N1/adenine58-N1)-methyltransferase